MMKKIVIGLAVCFIVVNTLRVEGMNEGVIQKVVSSPSNSENLRELVSCVMKDNKDVLQARSSISSEAEKVTDGEELKQLLLYRISSMLYQLSRDIRTYGTDSIDHYVYGVIAGDFGPFED